MKIEFIKDHPVGIPKGTIVSQNEIWCNDMIKEGYAKEVKGEKDPIKWDLETKEEKKRTKK